MRENIEKLKADIKALEEEEKARESATATRYARIQARMLLEGIFAPYMTGVCNTWGVSPREALRILIEEEATFGKIAKNNPAELANFKKDPAIKVMLSMAKFKSLGDVSDEWIKDKMTVLLEVMKSIRPELAIGIIETPGGTEWFYQSLVGLRDIFFGSPQLNIDKP